VLNQCLDHYHAGRAHQGLDGEIIDPEDTPASTPTAGEVVRRKRLGWLLSYYTTAPPDPSSRPKPECSVPGSAPARLDPVRARRSIPVCRSASARWLTNSAETGREPGFLHRRVVGNPRPNRPIHEIDEFPNRTARNNVPRNARSGLHLSVECPDVPGVVPNRSGTTPAREHRKLIPRPLPSVPLPATFTP
jgi:hypothetical protein